MALIEKIVTAKTVDDAVKTGAAALGKNVSDVKYEVLEEPKKGFLGLGAVDAKVRVYVEENDASAGFAFADGVIGDYDEELHHEEPASDEEEQEDTVSDEDADDEADEDDYYEEDEDYEPYHSKFDSYVEDGQSPEDAAVTFLNSLICDLGIDAKAQITNVEENLPEGKTNVQKDVYVEINGEGLGTLIGRHGDVLDALQYLANIAAGRVQKANPEKKEHIRICLDIEDYRVKREDTLKQLARRKAQQALNTHRNVVLEPMLAYERRVIHSELQNVEGVYTYSVGSDNDRKVVIALGTPENPLTPIYTGRKNYGRGYRR